MKIGIIGAGASGMAAAIAASNCKNTQVLLFERQARVGRKLQATGNGRCNLSNYRPFDHAYHGEIPEFANRALQIFDVAETMYWFAQLGLYMVREESGRVYPYSDQANSVVDVLRFALNRENITLLTGFEVLNPELEICRMNKKADLRLELTINKGRGYVSADENRATFVSDDVQILAIDSIFTPIRNVKFEVED